MLLEIDNKAPIPTMNVCACCLAEGEAADLRKYSCTATLKIDDKPSVRMALPMCKKCRIQRKRAYKIMVPGGILALVGAIAAAVVGFLMDDIVSAFIFAFLAFIVIFLVVVAVFNAQRIGYSGHAKWCEPIASGEIITTIGGGGSGRCGVSTLYRVDFANDEFAKQLLRVSSARVRLPGSWSSIGICFDIDALKKIAGGGAISYYGAPARLIFMRLFDPKIIGAAFVFHGDTSATLAGDAHQWCIAVAVKDIAAIEMLIKTFSESSDPGLAPLPARFIHHARDVTVQNGTITTLGTESLPLWFSVDGEGTIIFPDPPEREDVALCNRFDRAWTVAKRQPR